MHVRMEDAVTGGPLKIYDVVVYGYKTQMQLNDDDAKRYGVSDQHAPAAEHPVAKKAAKPRNKSRTAQTKD